MSHTGTQESDIKNPEKSQRMKHYRQTKKNTPTIQVEVYLNPDLVPQGQKARLKNANSLKSVVEKAARGNLQRLST